MFFERQIYRWALKFVAQLRPLFDVLPVRFREIIKSRMRQSIQNVELPEGSLVSRTMIDGHTLQLTAAEYSRLSPGIDMVGFPKGDLGLGQMFRGVHSAVSAAGIPNTVEDYGKILSHTQNATPIVENNHEATKRAKLFMYSAEQLYMYSSEKGDAFFNDQYRIHYGAWELSHYPDAWVPAFNLADEFWCMSSFMAHVVAERSNIPTLTIPIPVAPKMPGFGRRELGLPEDRFLVLCSFDLASVMERKNPKAAIDAFKAAFDSPNFDDAVLLLKVNHVPGRKDHSQNLILLKQWIGDSTNILLLDKVLSHEEQMALINCCDVYLSLHRAEGFGLGLAEAMYFEKPVVATGYSGNLEFMNSFNSCLVDYKMVDVANGAYIHWQGQRWAEPSVEAAAESLIKLFENSQFRKELGRRAGLDIRSNLSVEKIALQIKKRLQFLGII